MRPTTTVLRVVALLVIGFSSTVALAAEFRCDDRAFDLSGCTDPTDTTTCPQICTTPPAPQACATAPLPEIADQVRQTPGQPILRETLVEEGPFSGVSLSMVTLGVLDDSRFALTRALLCVVPTTPTPPPSSGGGSTSTPPPAPGGSGLVGGTPGLVGGSPGLVGGNPGLVGGNPGLTR